MPLFVRQQHKQLAQPWTLTHCTVVLLQVAAFVLGRGALTLPLSLFQFTAVMLAPFMPAEIAADKVAAPNSSTPASEAAEQQQKAGLANEAPAAERAASGDILSPFKLAGTSPPSREPVCGMYRMHPNCSGMLLSCSPQQLAESVWAMHGVS